MKLILVDCHSKFREVLKSFVEFKLNHRVIGDADSPEDFLKLENFDKADIILMDLIMDTMNSFDVTKQILWNFPDLKIIAITMVSDDVLHQKIMETGFKGYILKTEIFKSLDTVLKSVYSDVPEFSQTMNYMVSR